MTRHYSFAIIAVTFSFYLMVFGLLSLIKNEFLTDLIDRSFNPANTTLMVFTVPFAILSFDLATQRLFGVYRAKNKAAYRAKKLEKELIRMGKREAFLEKLPRQ